MRYQISVNFEAPVVVDGPPGGRQTLSFEGTGEPPESTDLWRLQGRVEVPERRGERPNSGTLNITGPIGGSLSAVLDHGGLEPITDDSGRVGAGRLDLWFAVTDAAGSFSGATGKIHVQGTIEPQGGFLTADLNLDAPEGAWSPPNASILTQAEGASGSSHVAGP